MSKQRFEFYSDEDLIGVLDTVTGRTFNSFEIVDCLNEQQVTITALKEENEQLKSRIAFFEEQEDEFEKYTAQTIKNMIVDYREG